MVVIEKTEENKSMKIHQDCQYIGKKVTIDFRRDVVKNGNGPDKVYEIPIKCSQSQCPNAGKCIYMQERSHWG